MSYWDTMQDYYVKQGIPRRISKHFSLRPAEALQISAIIAHQRPQRILEVGTFIGMSTGIIAHASEPFQSALVCVDPNFPVGPFISLYVPETHLSDQRRTLDDFVGPMLTHFGHAGRAKLRTGFFSRLSPWMYERVSAGGNGTPEEAPIIGEHIGEDAPFDLAFIDGDHESEAVYHDLSLLAPYMTPGGVIVMHDVGDFWGEKVRTGINKFRQEHPEFAFAASQNLGFVSRDRAMDWLPPFRNPLLPRIRRKTKHVLATA